MRQLVYLSLIAIAFVCIFNSSVMAEQGMIDESDIESLIRRTFEVYANLYKDPRNVIDFNAEPIKPEYYPGKGDYATAESLERLLNSVFTENMLEMLERDFDAYYKIEEGNVIFRNNYDRKYSYALPESVLDNTQIVYNRENEAYVITTYIQHSRFFTETRPGILVCT